MSVRLIGEVLRTPLGSTQKLVLLVLADAASEEGVCWPKQSTISQRASVTDRTVRRILDDLKEIGLVSWEQRGLRKSNRYLIDVERLREFAAMGDDWQTAESSPAKTERTPVSSPDGTPMSSQEWTPMSSPSGTVNRTVKGTTTSIREPDLIFEAVCQACGIDWTAAMTKSQRGQINRAVKELRDIDATPDDILRVATAYRLRWPEMDLTPNAITKHWNLVRAPLPSSEASAAARRRLLNRPDSDMEGEPAWKHLTGPQLALDAPQTEVDE